MTLSDSQVVVALLRMEQHIDRLEAGLREPIAIVGVGERTPFEALGVSVWDGLSKGLDASRDVPGDRWDPNSEAHTAKRGSFLADVQHFDAQFFAVAPVEAQAMDPQQRIVLETVWDALSNAGVSLDAARKAHTGVFLGACNTNDYGMLASAVELPDGVASYLATGNAGSVLSGRVSYALGLMGPSFVVDTACSSSLVAVHLACESLRARTSDVALAGGVNLILSPHASTMLSNLGALSADGRCRTFDATGSGYGRGEGCGIVVLKRLSDAVRDGDRILALIRGSAVNQDGRSDGLTAPNGLAQQQVIRAALEFAKLAPGDVQYVEAHGTGTVLGDPIEVEALSEVFGTSHAKTSPLAIGSVKSNIGHLEAAAGISGLLKVILSVQHRELPASLHFHTPNPHIPWERMAVRVQTKLGAWPEPDKPLIAGVSSFGFSGTNAHVVVSEAPPEAAEACAEADRLAAEAMLLPLCVSAKTPKALRAYAERFAEYLALPLDAEATWRDVSFTSVVRQTHLEHRLVVVGANAGEWRDALASFAAGESASVVGDATNPVEQAVFVFSGQGTQWWGMGRELIEREPVFRATLEECAGYIRKEADWSLLEELGRDEASSRLQRTDIAQPALVSLQMGLVRLLASWGVEPAAVVGHSVGEIAAAFAAGVLTLEQACRLATVRGRVMHKASGHGKMAAVRLSAEKAEAIAREFPSFANEEERTAKRASARYPHLVHVTGVSRGKSRRILGTEIVLGRARGSDLRIKEDGVSRSHARITLLEEGTYAIEDVGSTNGTFVNGEKITERLPLKAGDEIRLGKTTVVRWMLIGELDQLWDEADEPSTSTGWASLETPTQRIVVGAYNGPESVVISGEPEAMKRALEMVGEHGAEARELQVDYAFHSPQMDRFMGELAEALTSLKPSPARIPIVSTLTGTADAVFDGAYWVRQMREPVRFTQATQVLFDWGYDLFVEVGAHPVLLASIDETSSGTSKRPRLVPTLRRKGGQRTLLEALGALHCAGYPVNWEKVLGGRGRVVRLPSYPWQRQRYWLPAQKAKRQGRDGKWALIHTHVAGSDQPGKHVFELEVDLGDDRLAYLADYEVQGEVRLPIGVFADMALEAASVAFAGREATIEELRLSQALNLRASEPLVLQLVLQSAQGGSNVFRFASRPAKESAVSWTEHASGRIGFDRESASEGWARSTLQELQKRCAHVATVRGLYDELRAAGLSHGPAFQGIEQAWKGEGEALTKLVGLDKLTAYESGYVVHPLLLEAAFLSSAVPVQGGPDRPTYVPSAVGALRVVGKGTPRWAHVTVRTVTDDGMESDVRLLDDRGRVLVEVKALRSATLGRAMDKLDESLFEIAWRPSASNATESADGRWLLLADEQGVASDLRRKLEAGGVEVVTVTRGEGFRRHGATAYQLDPLTPEPLARLMKEAFGKTAPKRVVHLMSLDARASSDDALDGGVLLRAQDLACKSSVHLLRAITEMGWSAPPRIFFVTRGSQPATGSRDVTFPEQALLWGVGASASYPLEVTLLDLDGAITSSRPEALAHELMHADTESRVALRGSERLVQRLVRHTRPKKTPGALRPLTVGPDEGYVLDVLTPPRLDSMTLRPAAVPKPAAGQVVIRTRASGVSFRDVLIAQGQYPGLGEGRLPMGSECAGTVYAVGEGVSAFGVGDDVIAVGVHGFDAYVLASAELVVKKPASLSFEQAACLPSAGMTALYA
ncbi:MAG TPA: acyltransferase domain-containing protein, partial [Labilithrix sp.]|nr:acyltransferase domain-containing protein [Labilithrix sp.]